MSIRVVIIHQNQKKGRALEVAVNNDKDCRVLGVYRKTSDALSYILGTDVTIVILSEILDKSTAYEFIINLMKSKPTACLMISELDQDVEIDYPRALDYSIVDTFTAEYSNDELMFPARLLIKAKILSKMNIDRFRSQIDQINNFNPDQQQEKKDYGNTESASKMQILRDRTSIKAIQANTPQVVDIDTGRKYDSIVVIGASTGGPRMLVYIVSQLPKDFPPVLIVQHMPQGFVGAFAERMNSNAQINVKMAENGDDILPGNVYIAPGGRHLELERVVGNKVRAMITDGPKVNFVKPAVDVTLFSAARVYGNKTISVVLTGMGSDGREGSRIVKKQGGRVIALNETDSVIFGMNKAVIDAGLADAITGMDGVVPTIGNFLTRDN